MGSFASQRSGLRSSSVRLIAMIDEIMSVFHLPVALSMVLEV